MEAKTLNCPMCGAAARTDASHCEHCGSRLATVACPSCFDLVFVGQKFCAGCGSAVARTDVENGKVGPCPRCRQQLHSIKIGETPANECAQCDGLWLTNSVFKEVCARSLKQAAFTGLPAVVNPRTGKSVGIEPVRYIKCPDCAQLMSRVNFGGSSGVIVDVCRAHGTWFDRAELKRILEFIQAGGMKKQYDEQVRALTQERRRLSAGPIGGISSAADSGGWIGSSACTEWDVISCVVEVVANLFSD